MFASFTYLAVTRIYNVNDTKEVQLGVLILCTLLATSSRGGSYSSTVPVVSNMTALMPRLGTQPNEGYIRLQRRGLHFDTEISQGQEIRRLDESR